jgi:hypothetical protein
MPRNISKSWSLIDLAVVLIAIFAITGTMFLFLPGRPPLKADAQLPDCVPGQIVVQIKNSNSEAEARLLKEAGAETVSTLSEDGQSFALLQVNPEKEHFLHSLAVLRQDKTSFALVQPNMHYYLDGVQRNSAWPASGNPNDPSLAEQPQVSVHDAVRGQHLLYKYRKMPIAGAVTIGIIDTGVEGSINEFASGQVLKGRNVWTEGPGNKDSDPGRTFGHGTFIGALMAATTNNGVNGIGFLPGAKIFPVDIFNGKQGTDTFHIIEAIQLVQEQKNVRFINLSVNAPPPNTLNSDVAYMSAAQSFSEKRRGCIVNAAGNSAARDISKARPCNVVVAAVDDNLKLASFSNFGPAIAMAGCGVNDGSSNRLNKFIHGNGTSFAAPSVCAVAAMIQYAAPNYSLEQILKVMRSTAKAGPGKVPVPDAYSALKSITGQ